MAASDYWDEVDRQSAQLSDQDIRELKYLLGVLHGQRVSRAKLQTRLKWFSITIGVIVALEQTWDWLATRLFHHS